MPFFGFHICVPSSVYSVAVLRNMFFFYFASALARRELASVANIAFCYFFILSNRDWKAIAESIHSRMKVAEVNEPLLAHELLIEDDEDVFIPQ